MRLPAGLGRAVPADPGSGVKRLGFALLLEPAKRAAPRWLKARAAEFVRRRRAPAEAMEAVLRELVHRSDHLKGRLDQLEGEVRRLGDQIDECRSGISEVAQLRGDVGNARTLVDQTCLRLGELDAEIEEIRSIVVVRACRS